MNTDDMNDFILKDLAIEELTARVAELENPWKPVIEGEYVSQALYLVKTKEGLITTCPKYDGAPWGAYANIEMYAPIPALPQHEGGEG